MTRVAEKPAQAASAGGQGRPPASPRAPKSPSQSGAATEREAPNGQGPRDTEPGSRAHSGRGTAHLHRILPKAIAARRAKAGVYDPKVDCGAHRTTNQVECAKPKGCRRPEHRCTLPKGWGTDHVRSGHCRKHLGTSSTGRKHAAVEQAAKAAARLGLPVGSGSPLQLLEKTVRYAEGHLEISAELLQELDAVPTAKRAPLVVEVAREWFRKAVRDAARVGKEAADAHIAERRAAIDEMIVGLLERVLRAGLDEIGASADQVELALTRMHRELIVALPSSDELN